MSASSTTIPAVEEPVEPVAGRALRPSLPRSLVELGGMGVLGAQATWRASRPPFSYFPEFIEQFRFALKIAWFPLILMSFALSFGPAGIQASAFFALFGALDRLGGAYELIVVREFAPLVTAIIVAGAVGTAMCADLGAREIREETDALRVLGVDPIKSLVVPRFLAIIAVSVLFNVFALISGLAGAVVVVLQNGGELGPFFTTFLNNATPLEFGASLLKCLVYGSMIAVVSCYKGMNTSGGPEGVGRAVNQSVVITFLLIGAIDYVFTQFLLATNPILSQTR